MTAETATPAVTSSKSERWGRIDRIGGAALWTAFAASFGLMFAMS